jgi:hemin uptake protein HemP
MPEANPPVEPAKPPATSLVIVDARELFQGQREIHIEHEGIRYRLRITRRNKLILQK